MPPELANRPTLQPGLELYFDAFNALSTCRAIGMGGEGPIPWTAIDTYCERYQIRGMQRENLYFFVRSLDLEYLQRQSRKLKKR